MTIDYNVLRALCSQFADHAGAYYSFRRRGQAEPDQKWAKGAAGADAITGPEPPQIALDRAAWATRSQVCRRQQTGMTSFYPGLGEGQSGVTVIARGGIG